MSPPVVLARVKSGAGSPASSAAPGRGAATTATTGLDIALSDFKGKKWVLLEFYGADFAPT